MRKQRPEEFLDHGEGQRFLVDRFGKSNTGAFACQDHPNGRVRSSETSGKTFESSIKSR